MFPWSEEASVREGWIFISLDAVGRQVGQDLGLGKRLRSERVGFFISPDAVRRGVVWRWWYGIQVTRIRRQEGKAQGVV